MSNWYVFRFFDIAWRRRRCVRVFVYFQCFFVMPEGRNVIGNLKFWLGDRIGIRDRVMNFTGQHEHLKSDIGFRGYSIKKHLNPPIHPNPQAILWIQIHWILSIFPDFTLYICIYRLGSVFQSKKNRTRCQTPTHHRSWGPKLCYLLPLEKESEKKMFDTTVCVVVLLCLSTNFNHFLPKVTAAIFCVPTE